VSHVTVLAIEFHDQGSFIPHLMGRVVPQPRTIPGGGGSVHIWNSLAQYLERPALRFHVMIEGSGGDAIATHEAAVVEAFRDKSLPLWARVALGLTLHPYVHANRGHEFIAALRRFWLLFDRMQIHSGYAPVVPTIPHIIEAAEDVLLRRRMIGVAFDMRSVNRTPWQVVTNPGGVEQKGEDPVYAPYDFAGKTPHRLDGWGRKPWELWAGLECPESCGPGR
jgi:hypothetical protein